MITESEPANKTTNRTILVNIEKIPTKKGRGRPPKITPALKFD